MNAITTIARAPKATKRAPLAKVTGKGASARLDAFEAIAPKAYVDGMSRAELMASINIALGLAPTEEQLESAKREYVIGRAAQRLADGEYPKANMAGGDKLHFMRSLVTQYAAPTPDGKKAKALRNGQIGRRSIAQHKAIRAAEEAWSLIKAETGYGQAMTQSARNASKSDASKSDANKAARGTKAPGVAAPNTTQLATPAKALTADDACQHVATQLATLQLFCNKNAKLIPAGLGAVVIAAKKACDKEMALIASTKPDIKF